MDIKRLEANVDAVFADAVNATGVLGGYVSDIYTSLEERARSKNESKKKRGLDGVLSEEQLLADVKKQHQEIVDKKLKPVLLQVVHGEAASLDIKEITGLVGGVSNTWSAFQTLNPLAIIPAVMSLISNSIIGDYVKGFLLSRQEPEKYPTLGEAVQQVKLDRSVANIAAQFKVDKDELFTALTSEQASVPPELNAVDKVGANAGALRGVAPVVVDTGKGKTGTMSPPPPAAQLEQTGGLVRP